MKQFGGANVLHTTGEEAEQQSIHGPYVPEDVREGEAIKAVIKSRDVAFPFEREMRVWKLSPLGIELLVKQSDEVLPKGLSIDLELTIGRQFLEFRGLVVDYIAERFNRNYICIRLTQDERPRALGVERRSQSRWVCSPQYYPTCVAANPAKYNDFIYFSIRDISKDGAQLVTSLRNKFIVSGMVFDALVSFPMIGQTQIKFKVQNVRVVSDRGVEQLAIGSIFIDNDESIKKVLAQYVLQFSNVGSYSDVKGIYGPGVSLAKALSFSYVRTEEEYMQVLALRHKAYLAAGKITNLTRPQDMADEYDARSRIVIGKYKDKIIACCRLTFSSYEDKMEQEKYVTWPQELPRRDECVEMMRLCTDPDFRGSDLIVPMFQFMGLAIVQSKRRWVVICATEDMQPFYEKIGFITTGLFYEHPKLNNKVHHIMYADVVKGMQGAKVGPIVWNIVWRDVVSYMRNYNMIAPDPLTNVRLAIYRLFAPFATWLSNKYKSPRKIASKKT